jgi:uridylate kinase
MGESSYGIDSGVPHSIATEIRDVSHLGLELALVIGGGNIFRGVQAATAGRPRHRRTTWACWRR